RLQLEAFKQYAGQIGQHQIVKTYERALAVINEIMTSKSIGADDVREAETDEFLRAIKKNAQEIAQGRTPSGMKVLD
ncbi:MAG: hypothetical protein Q7R65_03205, partial [bacterium]|nr:hypothetical protein [bacterium]